MQVHIQNDGPVTLELESPVVKSNGKFKNKTSSANNTQKTLEDDKNVEIS